jgi:hypothetical protein
MEFLTQKLIACVTLLAMLFASVACACDDGDHAGIAADQAQAIACRHHEDGPGEPDRDTGHDQHHHESDACGCQSQIVYVNSHGATPDLRPAALAAWHHVVPALPTLLTQGFVEPSTSHSFPAAIPPPFRPDTSLLRQHCALII